VLFTDLSNNYATDSTVQNTLGAISVFNVGWDFVGPYVFWLIPHFISIFFGIFATFLFLYVYYVRNLRVHSDKKRNSKYLPIHRKQKLSALLM